MSWEQLREILDSSKQDQQLTLNQPPESCPIDGEPLEVNSRGVRNCPFGNYRW
jgi:hypothetical protein